MSASDGWVEDFAFADGAGPGLRAVLPAGAFFVAAGFFALDFEEAARLRAGGAAGATGEATPLAAAAGVDAVLIFFGTGVFGNLVSNPSAGRRRFATGFC